VRFRQRGFDRGEFPLLGFEGRIDQYEPAPFRRRQQRVQRGIAIPCVHVRAPVIAELSAQGIGFVGLRLAQHQSVIRT
jgi:hypothetical protein